MLVFLYIFVSMTESPWISDEGLVPDFTHLEWRIAVLSKHPGLICAARNERSKLSLSLLAESVTADWLDLFTLIGVPKDSQMISAD
jgi:hypothetical protein